MTTLVLDGRRVTVQPGRTILQCCEEHGISEASSCRLCLVEVEGLPRPLPACSTAVREGMVVSTATARLHAHRRSVVELLLSGGHHVCAFCPAAGRCELQALARRLGIDHRDPRDGHRAPALDASRARFAFDPGRCVLCTRCVRVCAEAEGAFTLHVAGRGARTRIVTDGGDRWAASPTCTDCGRCVAACPTGALLEKAAAAQGLAAVPSGEGAGRPVREADLDEPLHVTFEGPRARVATAWLGGCAGCHMSLLDLDEALLDLAGRMELVYSPLADAREMPEHVDVCLVEGAVATSADLALLRRIRERTRVLVALGDCATAGNVTAMRDGIGGADAVLRRAWADPAVRDPALPALLDPVLPLHAAVTVDRFVPGCPPPPYAIHRLLSGLLAGGTRGTSAEARTRG